MKHTIALQGCQFTTMLSVSVHTGHRRYSQFLNIVEVKMVSGPHTLIHKNTLCIFNATELTKNSSYVLTSKVNVKKHIRSKGVYYIPLHCST